MSVSHNDMYERSSSEATRQWSYQMILLKSTRIPECRNKYSVIRFTLVSEVIKATGLNMLNLPEYHKCRKINIPPYFNPHIYLIYSL